MVGCRVVHILRLCDPSLVAEVTYLPVMKEAEEGSGLCPGAPLRLLTVPCSVSTLPRFSLLGDLGVLGISGSFS